MLEFGPGGLVFRALKQSYDIKCGHVTQLYVMMMSIKHGKRPSEAEDSGHITIWGDKSQYICPLKALLLLK